MRNLNYVMFSLAVVCLSLFTCPDVGRAYELGEDYISVTATSSRDWPGPPMEEPGLRSIADATDGLNRNTTNADDMWYGAEILAPFSWAVFDMGGTAELDYVDIYNYNESGSYNLLRGVIRLDVSYSNDGLTYTTFADNITVNLAPGTDDPWGPSLSLPLGISARYIKFDDFLGNGPVYGYPDTIGLNEVEFYGTVTVVRTPGDTNLDEFVDAVDAATLASNWLSTGVGWAEGDFNGDDIVDDIDATLLATNWTGGPGSVAVPEPASLCLILAALGSLAVIRFTRRVA